MHNNVSSVEWQDFDVCIYVVNGHRHWTNRYYRGGHVAGQRARLKSTRLGTEKPDNGGQFFRPLFW